MVHFATWKRVLVLVLCVLGVLYALPNILARDTVRGWDEALPGWLPVQQVNLGLDLQGGSHLLMRVEYQEIVTERLEAVVDSIRSEFRGEDIGYTDLGVIGGGTAATVTVRDPAQLDQAEEIVRGLDDNAEITLVNGNELQITYGDDAIQEIQTNAVTQSIEIIRRRIDALGTNEPLIQRQGENRVLVQLPGVEDPERIKRLLQETARLTFHLQVGQPSVSRQALEAQLEPGLEILPNAAVDENENPQSWHLVRRRVQVSGETLVNAQATFDSNGSPAVSFEFDSIGTRRFGDTTAEHVNEYLAIVLDEEVISAPVIESPILGGQGIIRGQFSVQEANDLALLLRAGALPASLTILEERTVGPGLGEDSIEAGQMAAIIGLIAVVIFMILSYGLFGLFAVIALAFNLSLLLALLSLIQATLTLPGIAGIVLTVGMAVDANVLIFERIREETRNGRSPISAIDAGYSRAFTTIIDSNLTTLIAAILLFAMGAGPIRGFAVTLTFGIITSMFTAIMVTRLMVVTWLMRTRPKTLNV
jgi:preprotein translocase subunit SecD